MEEWPVVYGYPPSLPYIGHTSGHGDLVPEDQGKSSVTLMKNGKICGKRL